MDLFLTLEEKKFLSLAPFLITDLFEPDIKNIITPYLSLAKKMSFKKNQAILKEGQIVTSVFYITEGITNELIVSKTGLERMFIAFPHYLLGLGSVAHQQPILYTSYALTHVEAFVFSYSNFLSLMQQDGDLLKSVFKYISLDARRSNSVITQYASSTVLQKVCQILYCYYIGGKHYPNFKKLKLTQQLIASLAGVHRISVINALKELKENNYIALNKKELCIIEPVLIKEIGFDI